MGVRFAGILALLLVAVPSVAVGDPPGLVGTDPPGDAREWGARGLARETCAFACNTACVLKCPDDGVWKAFFDALIEPPKPSARLIRALAEHKRRIAR